MKPSWKWCRRILALGVALGLGIGVTLFLISRDEPPPPPDPGLTWSPRQVPAEENGYFAVRFTRPGGSDEDSPQPTWPEEDGAVLGPGNDFAVRAAEEILSENLPALQQFEKCLKAGDFVFEELSGIGWHESDDWTTIGLLVACRSRLLHETGKKAEAVSEALKLVRFGDRVRRAQGGLLGYGLGADLFEGGLEMLFWLVRHQQLDASRLKGLQAELASYLGKDQALEEAFLAGREYTVRMIEGLQAVRRGYWGWGGRDINLGFWGSLLPGAAVFKLNQTKRGLDLITRSLLEFARKTHAERRRDAERVVAEKVKDRRPGPLNGLGNIVLTMTAEGGCRLLMKDTKVRFHLSALRAVVALRSYRAAHGKLPPGLKDLVPEFLSEIPIDPIDDHPLRYSAEKGIIYSIGSDYRDAGGSEKADPAEAAADELEPTFQVSPLRDVQG